MFTQKLHLDPLELSVLRELKQEVGLSTFGEALKVVEHVLTCLGETLTPANAARLTRKMPDFFKLLFATSWRRAKKAAAINHLDELVNAVIERDQQERHRVLKRETQALSAVVITLKKLEKLVNLQQFDGLSHSIRRQLSDVHVGRAA